MTDQDLKNSVGIVETQNIRVVTEDAPLKLQSGKTLAPIDVAYETYGRMDEDGKNVILICHALTGNAHVAGYSSPEDKKPGWWDIMVGPGKPIDTEKYFVVCSNFLGGCSGTTGPSSINPDTDKPYGLDFPILTIADMVDVQKILLDKLGVKQILAVIGGSMGGMQVLQWTIAYPDIVKSAVIIASTSRLNAQSIAFDAVGRSAILSDVYFRKGQYASYTKGPDHGLGIARMIGHITYLSEESMRHKFGRQLRSAAQYSYDFNSEFAVETYLDYQSQTFVDRFDANSYLYITKAMDYFDLTKEYGTLEDALSNAQSKFMVVSISSDWLFTPAQSKELVGALVASKKDVSYCNIESPYGHDAFLLEPDTIGSLIGGFVGSLYQDVADSSAQTVRKTPKKKKHVFGRVDYQLIEELIEPNSRVLDVGCGDGQLLAKLIEDKNIEGEGIEINQDLIVQCISQGISVLHHNIDQGLGQYASKTFDYAILSKTLQTVNDTRLVFSELLRVAKRVIVSFPNFGHYFCRLQLMFNGLAPRSKQLPYRWYNSPNIHFLTIRDFDNFCDELGVTVEKKIPLKKYSKTPVKFAPNIFADQAVYVTSKDLIKQ